MSILNIELGNFNEILEAHLHKIILTAKKILKSSVRNKDMEELLQVGKIGLFEAYKSFSLKRNNGIKIKFWSYAQHRVKGSMIDHISRQSNMIRPSRQVERIMLKIKKMNLGDSSPHHIARELLCSERIAKEALAYSRIMHVESLNRSISQEDPTLELGEYLPSLTDFSTIEVENFINSLLYNEQTYLRYKLSNYDDDEIEKMMGIGSAKLYEIKKTLQQKAGESGSYKLFSKGEDELMAVEENLKRELTRAEYLKLKKKGKLDKDICESFNISKSSLIKNKQKWGVDQPRIKPLKDQGIAIASSPENTIPESYRQLESENLELRNHISVLEGKICELERESEVSQLQRAMEREAFWNILDILRAEIIRVKPLIGTKK